MSAWNPSSEPPDSREEPDCLCPYDGETVDECPAHGRPALRRESVYPVIRIRDAAGTLRTGYRPEAEDEQEADIEY